MRNINEIRGFVRLWAYETLRRIWNFLLGILWVCVIILYLILWTFSWLLNMDEALQKITNKILDGLLWLMIPLKSDK